MFAVVSCSMMCLTRDIYSMGRKQKKVNNMNDPIVRKIGGRTRADEQLILGQ
jgi:hypothetical protein